MANLMEILGEENELRVVSSKPSTTKNNCRIATLVDGSKAFIHSKDFGADGWTKHADGSASHPELLRYSAKREDGKSDQWLLFELPKRAAKTASSELE